MSTASYRIRGGDFEHAGSASTRLKEMLKKVGVEPNTIRRAMIAAYEAEMNVVIHAGDGVMDVALDKDRLELAVSDHGPGIPDIAQAMQEGVSTAPPQARELGFGAGMGLPNIQRNSDLFEIDSAPGQGVRLRIVIHLKPQMAAGAVRNSLLIAAERCTACLQCLRACPTNALRLRENRPVLLEERCIDCAACIDACEPGVFGIKAKDSVPTPAAGTILVAPLGFLTQFGPETSPVQAADALRDMGFAEVRIYEQWEQSLRDAVRAYMREAAGPRPVLVPVCPAVLNLIGLRFPSLVDHVAPFLTPMEAASEDLRGKSALYIIGCPSQHTALTPAANPISRNVLSPKELYNALRSRLGEKAPCTSMPPETISPISGEESVQVTGLRHVIRVLEEIENGLVPDLAVLELYACDQGCLGSPLWHVDPFLARKRGVYAPLAASRAVRRKQRPAPRPGFRLDADMAKAIAKLAAIDRLTKELPGRNCGVCGAPACAVLAEDIALGRAALSACPYRSEKKEPSE